MGKHKEHKIEAVLTEDDAIFMLANIALFGANAAGSMMDNARKMVSGNARPENVEAMALFVAIQAVIEAASALSDVSVGVLEHLGGRQAFEDAEGNLRLVDDDDDEDGPIAPIVKMKL